MTAEMCEVTDTLGGVAGFIQRICMEQVYTRYRRKEDICYVKE